ncbi:hypothetical protein HX870_32800 [Pseudomonas gingeri]|uniref:Short-chain dehydrogenase n=1 Tax=Pseudomonas gingeri TaxID=117681 RepID=A0A7Y8C0M9_9PSED|nr:hypothetical protein [Pseudomonas gingeri]NWA29299.1 hypothetical protein [Pseudomonas gingeri]NWB94322.1 hypothetical protein [Pseudomonas gingeri]NWD72391.1 hypothetical protein [Pseudomonas gingeri]NWD76709.1 hypothetical protein [Pseudomonas gingeri]
MTNFIALQSNTTETPVLFFNPDAPLRDLCAFASRRLRGARDLSQTLTCTTINNLDEQDFRHVMEVMYTLLDDGCDVLSVVEQRTMKLTN